MSSLTERKPLRLWPGVVLAILLVFGRFILPLLWSEAVFYGFMGSVVCALLIILWWLFFSRAPWKERLAAFGLMLVALYATFYILHPSIRGGMMGMMFPMFAIPILTVLFVLWAVTTRNLSDGTRRVTMVLTILVACGAWLLLRTNGITGEANSDLQWRWTKTSEEELLAQEGNERESTAVNEQGKGAAEWPGFRGPDRDGIVHGIRIKTDWNTSPPVEIWRKPIGPGWSSFAIAGDVFYTQEQRGESELVSCYRVSNGQPVWKHSDAARFWESNAGAGPRGTPTLRDVRVYTFGATGILNALDASNGKAIWSRNAAADTHTKVPGWGFASSPLVVDDVVIVATAGKLAAYDINSGKPRWFGPAHSGGYSSPHLLKIGGSTQIALMSGTGVTSVRPSDGKVLWEHAWPGDAIVQPAVTADGDILLGSGSGMGGVIGIRRIAVAQGSSGWGIKERWTSNGLKPYFNDFVIHRGQAFGFDGSYLSCINLKDGERKWKGGHYGHGQLLALADQDVLLVLSEQGDLALVSATPDKFTELARFSAIKGKTWNHPALVGGILLVRNGEEMAAFRLPS